MMATTRHELVRITLVTGIEHDLVARSIEDVVQCERQLDDAEVSAEMAADLRDRVDDRVADLLRHLGELGAVKFPQVERGVDLIE